MRWFSRSSPPKQRHWPRIGLTLFWGFFGGLAVVAATVALTGSYQVIAAPALGSWYEGRAATVHFVRTSPPVRWWRLRHVTIPDLETAVATRSYERTVLEYSWTDGHGPGDVFLRLDGRGGCDLKLLRREPQTIETYHADVTADRTHAILSTIVSTKFLHLLPETTGYMVLGLGRYSVTVTVNGQSRTLVYDGMQTVDDMKVFVQVRNAILSLQKELGVDFDWQATSYTTGR